MSAALGSPWPTQEGPDPSEQTEAGVGFVDLVVGEGTQAVEGAIVSVHYTGMLVDGTVFDSSLERGEQFSFLIGGHQVIRGWEDGLLGMRVGGVRRLEIPPELGYGQRSSGPIPPGSTLFFEIELFEVQAPRETPKALAEVPEGAFKTLRSGLAYADLVVGDGLRPRAGERVCVDYALWVDGELLEHTYSKTHCWWHRYDHSMNVMPGLTEGLKKMRVGGRRQLRIPSSLAYGPVGNDTVPPDTDVVVDVTLVEVPER